MADRQLLNRYTVLSSRDVDAVREALSQVYFDVTFAPREPYKSFGAKLNAVPLASGIVLSSLAVGTGFDISCPAIPAVYDFSMLLEGVGQAKVGRVTCDVARKSGVIMSPSRPVQMVGITATTGLGINITADVLERRLTALTGQELHEPLEFDPCMQLEGPVGGVWRFAWYVANEINRDAGLHSNALLMNQFSETLLNSLLLTQPHNYSALLNRLGRSSGPNYVRLAEEYLESHCDEPVTVERLAQIAGVSVERVVCRFQTASCLYAHAVPQAGASASRAGTTVGSGGRNYRTRGCSSLGILPPRPIQRRLSTDVRRESVRNTAPLQSVQSLNLMQCERSLRRHLSRSSIVQSVCSTRREELENPAGTEKPT